MPVILILLLKKKYFSETFIPESGLLKINAFFRTVHNFTFNQNSNLFSKDTLNRYYSYIPFFQAATTSFIISKVLRKIVFKWRFLFKFLIVIIFAVLTIYLLHSLGNLCIWLKNNFIIPDLILFLFIVGVIYFSGLFIYESI